MAPVRIALLICDTPVPPVVRESGDYLQIYGDWLRNSLRTALGDTVVPESRFIMDGYDVVHKMEYPDLDQYEALVLTGSSASAYEPLEWITKLVNFMTDVVKSRPHLPIVALCLGHQIMARALGGSVAPNNGHWELGVYEMELNEVGREFFGVPVLKLQQVHRDHVPSLPPYPNIKLLGSTPLTPIHGFIVPREDASSTHIFTLQGHPEFTASIVQHIVHARGPNGTGVVDPATAEDALKRARLPHDGLGIIGTKALEVLGVL
ncbi:class I glutamine amidotransferase-like protein [Sistotremastrum niveocremeum HHB9708]|uniref:Class I glutamine amidotransferase-like protein n=2 Tax=Sistotremastraceae TaxID=3402574 RepID=A0A164N5Q4_9AGAM|nr:class I glutamine amidotransferase-like protein [Sistotremastrum niveocremeum HHB9708]KZT39852.1 class I glutamine amidotransferase-like protein [Sistotremastrum suecicum HHB10207 ss-3]